MIDIRIGTERVYGFEPAMRGMRNSFNSWDKSDSCKCLLPDDDYCGNCPIYDSHGHDQNGPACDVDDTEFAIGPEDLKLAKKLCKAGSSHAKFRRMIVVYIDICAPLYWWKEFDTYKVGTVANSCSTMHTIDDKPFELLDFSCEKLIDKVQNLIENDPESFNIEMQESYSVDAMKVVIEALNHYRKLYIETKDKKYWWQLIQLLPSSFMQQRTVMLNYETLAKIYQERVNHKLDEWKIFCDWVEKLPYANDLICINWWKNVGF